MPACADSLMSRTTGRPSGVTPKGTRRRSRPSRRRHRRSGSKSRTSPISSRSIRSAERLGSDWPTGVSDSGRSSPVQRVMRRATASAWATPTASGTARIGLRSLRRTSIAPFSPSRRSSPLGWRTRRRVDRDTSDPQEVAGRSTVTPSVPSGEPSRVPAGRTASSTTRITCGQAMVSSRGRKAARAVTSSPSRSASSAGSVATMRAPPRASATSVDRACGSHLTHSHCPRDRSEHRTAIRSAVGGTKTARWASMARTCARAGSSAPATSI